MEKCTNNHKKELLEAIKSSASENCFLFGDIENFSMDDDFLDIWRVVKEGKTTSILLRYFKSYIVYSIDSRDYKDIAHIINSDKDTQIVSGLETTLKDLSKFISFKSIKNMYLAELNKETYKNTESKITPKRATVKDLDSVFNFECSIEEFSMKKDDMEAFSKGVKTDTGRIYFIEKEGKVVSTAGLTAENSVNGMVIGVATDPAHRREGLAKCCVNKLCKEMVSENKSVLLFYDNPDAGKLYKSLGFVDINRWSMAKM